MNRCWIKIDVPQKIHPRISSYCHFDVCPRGEGFKATRLEITLRQDYVAAIRDPWVVEPLNFRSVTKGQDLLFDRCNDVSMAFRDGHGTGLYPVVAFEEGNSWGKIVEVLKKPPLRTDQDRKITVDQFSSHEEARV